MYSSMEEIRKQQRTKKKHYRNLAHNRIITNPEEVGLVSFRNLYWNLDPTPAKADRKDYS